MHEGEVKVDEDLVARLIRGQFPELAELPIRRVEPWGTDNAIYRLGDELVARLPRMAWAEGQPALEHEWLPVLAPELPIAVPEPVALGRPSGPYPFRWSIHRWLIGEPAGPETINNPRKFAEDLAGVVRALQGVSPVGAPPARNRARPLQEYAGEALAAIAYAGDLIDQHAARTVWEKAVCAPPHDDTPVWVQGDLEGNCLTQGGKLSGIVDWGSACVGDPAVDVQVIWSPLFSTSSRVAFLEALDVDQATLERSRGAAIQQACAALRYYLDSYPLIVERSRHKLAALGVEVR
jgi:aminoglycoside phosphotransferase (APT) family kinase protein